MTLRLSFCELKGSALRAFCRLQASCGAQQTRDSHRKPARPQADAARLARHYPRMDGVQSMEAMRARQRNRATTLFWGSESRYTRALARTAALAGFIACSTSSDTSDSTSSPVPTHPESQPLSNYDVTIIRGDGRCLFRAAVVSAAQVMDLRAPSPSEELEAADLLRRQVVAEFRKRREEVEWFIEGDFDSYLRYMSQPNVWGGEPELLMLSHVLRWPIKVFVPARGQEYTHITAIGTYGEEYAADGKDAKVVKHPILLWYDGVGHYNALAERVAK